MELSEVVQTRRMILKYWAVAALQKMGGENNIKYGSKQWQGQGEVNPLLD
jgi:hypothetical protein